MTDHEFPVVLDEQSAGEMPNLLKRWFEHLEIRGEVVPGEDDFRTFGSLSTLHRLRAQLSEVAPEQCGPLRHVISDFEREKREETSTATGGQKGPAIALSIPKESLPDDWRLVLDNMTRLAKRREAGLLIVRGAWPPAASMIRDIEYVLRAISKACLDEGREPELNKTTIGMWLEREEGRGRRATGLSLQLRLMAQFLEFAGKKKNLAKRLRKLGAEYGRRGGSKKKRKFSWLDQNPIGIEDVWDKAEQLLVQSRAERAGTRKRYVLALHAAVIALSVNAPLRIGDLSRLRVGNEICRSTSGWSLKTDIRKTDGEYDLPQLWPEIAEFLDELFILDAPVGKMWSEYDRRVGTPLFSVDAGRTGLSADWVSDVYYEHIGTGAHIIRSIWHQLAYESDRDLTWMALALCGQRGARTKREYRERNARAKTVRAGRKSLADVRKRALEAALIDGHRGRST